MLPSTKCPSSFLQIIHTIYVQYRQNVLRWTIFTTLTISLSYMPVTDQQLMLILSSHFSTKTDIYTRPSSLQVDICRHHNKIFLPGNFIKPVFEFALLHNACKNSHCSRTCISQLFYCKVSIVNKQRISNSLACIETSETFKMSTHLFIIQPLYHWHALVDDYLPLNQANAADLESHPARLSQFCRQQLQ